MKPKRTSGWPNLIKGEIIELMPHSATARIPLAHSLLSAGPAVEITDDGHTMLDVNALIARNRKCLALVVTGDSMRPDIHPGYIVFIDPTLRPRNGDTVVASVNGETCVKVFEQLHCGLFLVPKNADFPTKEVQPSDRFHILGVVKAHLCVYGS
jgi:DNA polymerase V